MWVPVRKPPYSPVSPVMMAWRVVAFFSVGFCRSQIFLAASFDSTGNPKSRITSILLYGLPWGLLAGFSPLTPRARWIL